MKTIEEIKKAQADVKVFSKLVNQMIDDGTVTTVEEVAELWRGFRESKGIS